MKKPDFYKKKGAIINVIYSEFISYNSKGGVLVDYYNEKEKTPDDERLSEETVTQVYFDESNEKKDDLFSLSVFQATVCVILAAIVFLMSLMGGYKAEMIKAIDYFQSFEINKDDIKQEIDAMKSFLSDAQV